MRRTFDERVFPVLTPLAIDRGPPVPVHLESLALARRRAARGRPPKGRSTYFARVKVPPSSAALRPGRGAPAGQRWFVLLEDIIAHNLEALFPGLRIGVVRVPGHARRRLRSAGRRGRRSAARDRVGTAQAPLRRTGPARVESRNARIAARRCCSKRSSSSDFDCYEVDGMLGDGRAAGDRRPSTSPRCTTRRSRRRFPKRLIGADGHVRA